MSWGDDFSGLVGRKIKKIRGDSTKLVFELTDGLFSVEAEGDCCSSSWFEHMTGVCFALDAVVTEVVPVETADITDCDDNRKEEYPAESLQRYSYRVETTKGTFDIEMRNSSNGYYGGYLNIDENPSAKLLELPIIDEDF